MIGNSYISTVMNMYCDIYEQENVQDPNTGMIERHWEYKKTVKCVIQPSKSSGTATRGDNKKFIPTTGKYAENLQLRGKFTTQLSKRWRVAGIRNDNGDIIYKEFDRASLPETMFEVVSCHPMLDPFGHLSHYDVTLERVEVQRNDSA